MSGTMMLVLMHHAEQHGRPDEAQHHDRAFEPHPIVEKANPTAQPPFKELFVHQN
jgi:hypothetical protein